MSFTYLLQTKNIHNLQAVGAGAVIAGIIVFLIFNHFLPPIITELIRSNLSFLDALPYQLAILGTVVCLSTLLGCCGAILDGNVGKWLLIMVSYTVKTSRWTDKVVKFI